MNVFGPRSKRHANAGCGSVLRTRTGTENFRSRSLGPRAPNRRHRDMSERTGTPLSSLQGEYRDSYCTSATSKRAFALEPITCTKVRKGKTSETVFVVGEADVARHRRLFDAFVEKCRGGQTFCDE